MGAAEADITAEKVKDVQNVVVNKKGKTAETVIIGAHYDKASDGCGAIDNWTGIVIVGNLYRSMRNADTEKTYIFVAFDKEEVGLVGSGVMASSIPKENRPSYCSMVNLDSFGFAYPQVLENASNPKMTAMAKDLAAELKMPFASASLAGMADADSSTFQAMGIPAITFHGLSNKWQHYLHSSNDKLENINSGSVAVGYNFLLQYLAKIDSAACGVFRDKK
jgi:Zn-dependent M28 family amino/carboxypeptidase